jgi:hypothetical protein
MGGTGGRARGHRGIVVELGDEMAAPDKDLRWPASGRCSDGDNT